MQEDSMWGIDSTATTFYIYMPLCIPHVHIVNTVCNPGHCRVPCKNYNICMCTTHTSVQQHIAVIIRFEWQYAHPEHCVLDGRGWRNIQKNMCGFCSNVPWCINKLFAFRIAGYLQFELIHLMQLFRLWRVQMAQAKASPQWDKWPLALRLFLSKGILYNARQTLHLVRQKQGT